MTNQNY